LEPFWSDAQAGFRRLCDRGFFGAALLRDLVEGTDYYDEIDLVTAPEDPRNLFAAGAAAAPGDGSVLTMQKLSVPAPRGVVMIRPHHFRPNAATAEDNLFQATDVGRSAATIAVAAHGEVTRAAAALEAAGVAVHLFEDDGPRDAGFHLPQQLALHPFGWSCRALSDVLAEPAHGAPPGCD
jgi:hypothetical protein